MKINVYTVYDAKALVYGRPFYDVSDGSAVRNFTDLANDQQTTVGKHPSDFSMWMCAVYDDQLGLFHPVTPLRHVADAAALVKPRQDYFSNSPFDHSAGDDRVEHVARSPNGRA